MEKVSLKQIIGKITVEGKEITFQEFLNNMGGMNEIYTDYIGEMLDAALTADIDWDEVDDFIGPIAHEVIGAAVEEDREIYQDLVKAVKTAWDRLKVRQEKGPESFQLVIADGSIMDSSAAQAMIEHIADGMKLEKVEYVGCELTVTLRNVVVDHAGA